MRDPKQKRQTIGRLGTDFIGISVDADGEVNRLISGEAKWRKKLTQSAVDKIMLGTKKRVKIRGRKEKVFGLN